MMSLKQMQAMITATGDEIGSSEPYDYEALISTAMTIPKKEGELKETAMACQLVSYLSESFEHATELSRRTKFPDLLNYFTDMYESSSSAFKSVFRAALINFSIHQPTAVIYAEQRHISEVICNLQVYRVNLDAICKLNDRIERSLALKNAFLRMKDEENERENLEESLGAACRLMVFRDMSHSLKAGEKHLEQYFSEESCDVEAIANTLDCFALAAEIDSSSIAPFYGIVRESHEYWQNQGINEELDQEFYAIGSCCVSFMESTRPANTEDGFGVS